VNNCSGCRYEKTCAGTLRSSNPNCRLADWEPRRKINIESIPDEIVQKYNLCTGMIINGAQITE